MYYLVHHLVHKCLFNLDGQLISLSRKYIVFSKTKEKKNLLQFDVF